MQKEDVPCISAPGTPFRIGLAERLVEGRDVALLAAGALTAEALAAADALRGEGITAEVINLPTLKPLDAAAVRDAAHRCGCLVTAEEHSITGGLYEAVLGALGGEVLAPVVPVAMQDRFGETGPWRALLARFGLDAEGIRAAAREAVRRKRALGGS
nr:transketolase C-terminal domain-containing protein [Longimicrobium terrae]